MAGNSPADQPMRIDDPDTDDLTLDPPPLGVVDMSRPAVCIDNEGSAGLDPRLQAPVLSSLPGVPDLVIYLGVQSVDAATWDVHSTGNQGIIDRLARKEILVRPLESIGDAVPGLDLPRRVGPLTELIARTWSTNGLNLLCAHEDACRPSGRRHPVSEALATQRRRVARRIKTPKTK